MSSLASVLGGLGFFASAAADNFMDAFAARHNQKSLVPWISVNWDGWRITDEDIDSALDAPASSEIGITLREGVQALELVLAQDACARLVVSTADLKSRVDRWIKREFLRVPDTGGGKESLSLHPRPALQNSYVAPRDEVEQTVADIWQKLLGIDEVGVYDSLFDLGGDSLLVIQIISRLREAFHLEISLRSVFDAPTVAAISDKIRSGSKEAEQDAEEIIDVLDLIECLSDEEARLMLAGEADLK
jgi:acyl carrier protein